MSTHEKILMEQMLPLSSNSQNWELAKKEWKLQNISLSKNSVCLCTHFPITERCHLHNTTTHKSVIVGNCCVKKFIDSELKSHLIFKSLQRVSSWTSDCFNKATIELAYSNQWINEWEYNFYINVHRKRDFSDKQFAKVLQINNKILQQFSQTPESFH